jgi:hypothetical protein
MFFVARRARTLGVPTTVNSPRDKTLGLLLFAEPIHGDIPSRSNVRQTVSFGMEPTSVDPPQNDVAASY